MKGLISRLPGAMAFVITLVLTSSSPLCAQRAPGAADAGERVARAGGNAVDAALAAALVTMVTEVGIVSLSSGGFVTVQPRAGPAYTVDGWMDVPGRGSVALGNTWDIVTPLLRPFFPNLSNGQRLQVSRLQSRILRERFFSRLKILFYAAAALSQRFFDDLQKNARRKH